MCAVVLSGWALVLVLVWSGVERARLRGEIRCSLVQHLSGAHRHRISCVCVGRDGRTVVTGSRDCTLAVWDLHHQPNAKSESSLALPPAPCLHALRVACLHVCMTVESIDLDWDYDWDWGIGSRAV